MSTRSLVLAWIAVAALLLPAREAAAEGGPAVLTVTGQIEKTNRGPMDAFLDVLFAKYSEGFERAYAFDLADLQALPQHEVTTALPEWQGQSHAFEGPLVGEVLAVVGATGTKVAMTAVDGYQWEYERAVLEKAGFILALKMDGEPLGIGGPGPIRLMVSDKIEPAFPDGQPSEAGLVWALFHIAVE